MLAKKSKPNPFLELIRSLDYVFANRGQRFGNHRNRKLRARSNERLSVTRFNRYIINQISRKPGSSDQFEFD